MSELQMVGIVLLFPVFLFGLFLEMFTRKVIVKPKSRPKRWKRGRRFG